MHVHIGDFMSALFLYPLPHVCLDVNVCACTYNLFVSLCLCVCVLCRFVCVYVCVHACTYVSVRVCVCVSNKYMYLCSFCV